MGGGGISLRSELTGSWYQRAYLFVLLSLVNPIKKAGCMGSDRLAPFFVLGMCVDVLGGMKQ